MMMLCQRRGRVLPFSVILLIVHYCWVWKDIKAGVGKVKTKLSPSKLATKISGLASSKAFSRLSAGVNVASAPISLFLLGKSVVNGVIQKDYTTLGIVGGRLGIEAIEWGAKGVTKLAKAGSTLGKTTKFLGKAAGPVGALVDIGLSAWSLSKAVERLHASDNKYDKNDAIADIVGSSVDIAITAVVLVATIAFPPAGVVIAVIGIIASFATQLAVALFKTQNEIDRINSEVPLLDFEKSQQFNRRFMDWFGTRKKDYVDDLVTVKKLNDLFIKHNLDFLDKHPELSGIAFPARSIAYSGGCRAVRRTCGLKNIGGCTWNFDPDQVLASGCDHGQMCDGYSCTNDWESTGVWSYDEFECICDQSSNVQEGYPRLDNYIDFREKRNVYHERAVQAGVKGADFKCQPGHESYQGFRISERSKSQNFLCSGTIALYQRNRRGQTFYFDLEDGKDTVLLDESKEEGNTFIVGNGEKNFHGGKGRDAFMLHPNTSKVTGNLRGGLGENSLVISESFKRGKTLTFNGNVLSDEDWDVHLNAEDITELIGRVDDSEIVSPSCAIEKLQLRGGSYSQMDVVDIKDSCPSKNILTIVVEGNTRVKSSNKISRTFRVVSNPVGGGKRFEADLSEGKGFDATLFIGHTSGNLSGFDYKETDFRTRMSWKEFNTQYQYSLRFDLGENPEERGRIKVAFIEGDNLYSWLSFGSGRPSITHVLTETNGKMKRSGAPGLANNFLLQSGSWIVDCGKGYEGHFILYSEFSRGKISCGETKETSLSVHESHKKPLRLDLSKGVIGDISIHGIRTFYGRKNVQEEVVSGCDTEVIATQGGSPESPDIIDLSSRTACVGIKPLTVTCPGVTILRETDGIYKLAASIFVNIVDSPSLNFTAILRTESKTSFSIFLSELFLSYKEATSTKATNPNQIQISIHGRNGQLINFYINFSRELSGMLPGPEIIIRNNASEYNGHLILDVKGDAKVVHFLSEREGKTCKTYKGVEGIVNVFKILGPCWQITGAPGNNFANYFVLETQNATDGISISGDLSNLNNNLIVEKFGDPGKYALFDFKYERLGDSFAKSGRLSGIQHFMGREGVPDDITLSCDSEIISVDGRGGGIRKPDRVIISEPLDKQKCTSRIQKILVKNETEVDNTASVGNYLYEIELESGLDTVRIQPSETNHHVLQYRFLPAGIVQGAHFISENKTLELQFQFGGNLSYPVVFLPSGKINPEIRFVKKDGSNTCEILVEEEKEQVVAKWDIRGIENIQGLQVPLNTFIINIPTSTEITPFNQTIIGKERNEFWFLSFPKSGLLQLYGSGQYDEMHLSSNLFPSEVLTLDLIDGEARVFVGGEDRDLVRVEGIQKYYGRPGEKDAVWPGCDTSFLANMDEIVIHPDNCIYFFDIDLIIHAETEVRILTKNETLPKMEDYSFVEEPKGEFRYYFQEYFSFTPFTDWRYPNQFQSSNHTYFLPLTLGNLTSLEFLPWKETLRYTIGGKEVTHTMLVALEDRDEFYRQPKFVTREGCEIRVSRTYDIIAICKHGNFSADDLSESAKRLGVSVILLKEEEITYAGHNSVDDRNVLTTSRGMKNNLNGGAAKDTIYEIKFLEKDVVINSGFTSDLSPPETAKHTIDLTDVIVPLRIKDKNKYVPKVEKSGKDFIISLPEYEKEIPGKITILNGVEQSGLFQILLNSAMMQLKPLSENGTRKKREALFDETDDDWVISPVPIKVEPGSVYSLSQEDLENGHTILLDGVEVGENLTMASSFSISKDEEDLHLSDTISADANEATIIIISDFYPKPSQSMEENQTQHSSIPAQDISINLPGLEIMMEKSILFENFSFPEISSWDEVLEEVEEKLLQDLPEIPRVFKIRRPPSPLLISLGVFLLLVLLLFCMTVVFIIRRRYFWSYKLKILENNPIKKSMSFDIQLHEVKEYLEGVK